MEPDENEVDSGMETQNPGAARWMAPELIIGDLSSPSPCDDLAEHYERELKRRMSQRHYDNEGTYTTMSDVWSYGMTVYELMTGKVPYWQHPRPETVIYLLSKKELPSKPNQSTHLRRCMLWLLDEIGDALVYQPFL